VSIRQSTFFTEASEGSSHKMGGIDLGLGFAVAHRKVLFTLVLMPIAVKVLLMIWQPQPILKAQQLFLFAVVNLFADSWLLTAVVMMTLQFAREGKVGTPKEIGLRAVQFLPKVFVSYGLLFMIVASAFLLFPLLVFAVFFIWAPYFCIAESFAALPDPDNDDLYGSDEDDSSESQRIVRWFTGKSVFEMGFARSVHLAGAHVSTTMQLVLLMWVVNVVPIAALTLITPTYEGGFTLALKAMVSTVSMVFVLCAAAVVFLSCVPDEALAEIKIDTRWRDKFKLVENARLRFQNRAPVIVIAVAVAALSTYSLNLDFRASHIPPAELTATASAVAWQHQALRVELTLSDPKGDFRWFSENGIRLVPYVTEGPKQDNKDNSGSGLLARGKSNALFPRRVKVMGKNGEEHEFSRSTIDSETITLVLYVAKKEDGLTTEGAKFNLQYASPHGETRNLAELVIPALPPVTQ
jgi:hypothetical protein